VTARMNEQVKDRYGTAGKDDVGVLERVARLDDSGYEYARDDAVVADGCVGRGLRERTLYRRGSRLRTLTCCGSLALPR
jgi:hypothetical protein